MRVVLKSVMLMASVAEWFVLRMTASAKRNHRPAGEAVCFSFGICNFEISFDAI